MDALREAEGAVLNAVWASVHLFDGTTGWGKPNRLTLWFNARDPFTFKCAGDGETLLLERTIPEPVDMQEFGQFVIADFSVRTPWKAVVSCRLMHVERLVSHYFEMPKEIGLALVFEGGMSAFVFNLGDDLRVFETLPEAVATGEKLQRAGLF